MIPKERIFTATSAGVVPIIRPRETADTLSGLLEGGLVYGWDDLAGIANCSPEDVQWTCRRLHLDHGYSSLSIDRVLEAFAFAERHNPRPPRAIERHTASHPERLSARDSITSQQHETNAYGFTRPGVTA